MDRHIITQKILDILHTQHYWHEVFEHDPVTTSEEAARVRPEYTLAQGAKALIVKAIHKNGQEGFLMLVLPGHLKLDSKKVRLALGLREFRFATEDEVSHLTHGVKRGGVPPFGNLFLIPVYVDRALCTQTKIIFNAGDRRISVAMYCADYIRTVVPTMADIHADI